MNSNSGLGLFRVAAITPRVSLANPEANAKSIASLSRETSAMYDPSVIVFPELCVSGYSCEDLFFQQILLEGCENAVKEICTRTADLPCILIIGCPIIHGARLYNTAIVIRGGKILGIVPKSYIPGSEEFYEKRHFESGIRLGATPEPIHYAGMESQIGVLQLFRVGPWRFGIEICQDIWVPVTPSTYAALSGAELIFNLSASDELAGKDAVRRELIKATSSRIRAGYVYCCSGNGESTDDLVWSGASMICENGNLLAESPRFRQEAATLVADLDMDSIRRSRIADSNYSRDGVLWADAWPYSGNGSEYLVCDCGDEVSCDFEKSLYRPVDAHPFVPGDSAERKERCREVFDIQTAGLMSRLSAIRCSKAVIGISGGLDSTLALLVCVEAFDRLALPREGILAVSMPCFGTSERTRSNADALMEELAVSHRVIDITDAVKVHFRDIGLGESTHNTAYENAQARERTQVLMDLANMCGGIVIGTGDLSELALGWCTYNGDHMSMYGVNSSVPKTLVREIVLWKAEQLPDEVRSTLEDICDTPISPELLPGAQNTEDIIGPYELHDFFLVHFRDGESPRKILLYACHAFKGKYEPKTILHWLKVFVKRFFSQQFKRSCLPNGPKTGSSALSPRGDWRMSTDSSAELWLSDLKDKA